MPDVAQLPPRTSAPTKPSAPQADEQGRPAPVPESNRQIYTEEELEQEQARAASFAQETEEPAAPPPLPEQKISTPIAFLLIGYAALLDTIGVILVFFALDDFLILDILGAPLNLYFYLKGLKAKVATITTLLELVPYVGALPLKTAGVIAVIYLDRHPEKDVLNAIPALPGKK